MSADPRDLETIVTLLECAAIELSPKKGSTFTFGELFEMASIYGGPEIQLKELDVQIVVSNSTGRSGFLKKQGGRLSLR